MLSNQSSTIPEKHFLVYLPLQTSGLSGSGGGTKGHLTNWLRSAIFRGHTHLTRAGVTSAVSVDYPR